MTYAPINRRGIVFRQDAISRWLIRNLRSQIIDLPSILARTAISQRDQFLTSAEHMGTIVSVGQFVEINARVTWK
jgi:hypothetical protein